MDASIVTLVKTLYEIALGTDHHQLRINPALSVIEKDIAFIALAEGGRTVTVMIELLRSGSFLYSYFHALA